MVSVNHRQRKYKQMALEVAVRNPERYIDILRTFQKFEGKILNDKNILDIYAELYMDKAIETRNIKDEDLNTQYLKKYIKENNSHNNEWGFPTGYQAAFCRYLKTLSEFGFIYSQYCEPLELSEVAKALLQSRITLSEAFSLQCLKFWRMSPYRRVLNDFNYFKFIIEVLIELDKNNKKLSYPQFMVSLFSDDGDVSSFLSLIETEKIGNNMDKAYDLVFRKYNLIDDNHDKVIKENSAFRDYGNTVFRTLQLTGYISVDYSGVMMLSINKNRLDYYNELSKYDFSLLDYEKENPKKYFDKIGGYSFELDAVLSKYRDKDNSSTKDYNTKIKSIIRNYSLNEEILSNYLVDLCNNVNDNRCFWYISSPLKFELLLTLFVYSCYGDEFEYKPNYKCDDNGIPYSHAPGNIGDIEVYNKDNYWLIEATLIRNKYQQINSETINLFRHLTKTNYKKKYLTLVAPTIHEDTRLMIKVASLIIGIEKKETVYSLTQIIKDFIKDTKNKNNLYEIEWYSKEFIASLQEFLSSSNAYSNMD